MIEALLAPELLRGVGAGALGLALVAAAAAATRRNDRPTVPLAGLVLAAASLTALGLRLAPPRTVILGIGLLAVAGLLADVWPSCRPALPLLALPGAALVATDPELAAGPPWLMGLLVLTVVLGGPLVGSFDERWSDRGYGPVLMAGTVAGVYLTVPDTERLLVVLGVAGVLALTGWPRPVAHLGWAGSLAATGLVLWAAALDGASRPSAVVGSMACLGLLAVEPVARALLRDRGGPLDPLAGSWLALPVVAAAHALVVVVASRGAGLRSDLPTAAAVAGADLGIALVLCLAVGLVFGARPSQPAGHG